MAAGGSSGAPGGTPRARERTSPSGTSRALDPDPPDLPDGAPVLRAAGDGPPRLTERVLERVVAPGLVWHGTGLVDCRMEDCDFARIRVPAARLRRVAVAGGRFTGADCSAAVLEDVLVRDARADLCSLHGAQLVRVRFEECDFREAELGALRADAVTFVGCDLTGATLTGARFKRTELRGCRLDGIVGAEALRGVTMPYDDVIGAAATFAGALGIRIA